MDLWNLGRGQSAIITAFSSGLDQNHARRLLEIGFEPGEHVSCEQRMTLGGPRSYRTASGVFCLEREIASTIEVKIEK
jgi:Fe2+ transport system protein FeoA